MYFTVLYRYKIYLIVDLLDKGHKSVVTGSDSGRKCACSADFQFFFWDND